MNVLRIGAKVIFILVTLVLISTVVSRAGHAGVLTAIAVPLALVLIAGWRWLGPRAEMVAWAVFVLWLGLTYVNPAYPATLPRELTVAAIYALLAVLGLFVSPWFLAVGLAAHIGWDFVPRDLPAHLHELPVACMLYDGVLACYGGWQAYTRRWTPVRLKATPQPVTNG